MTLLWSSPAQRDIVRLHGFLAAVNPVAAARTVRELVAGIERLPGNPRLGRALEEYAPRNVRRLVLGAYEIRYEISGEDIVIIRLFHGREDR